MKPRILNTIGPAFAAEARKILEEAGEIDDAVPTQRELLKRVGDCTALIVRLGLSVDATVLKAARNLRVIASPTTGLDHIDLEEAERRGITVLSLKGETAFLRGITSTAELALGLLIALARNVPAASAAVLGGTWDPDAFTGTQLAGKTLGIVGVGRLGTMMAGYGRALGMRVIGYDRVEIDPSVCEQVSLAYLLGESDAVSVHLSLEESSTGMLDAAAIGRMKAGAVLVNTARGRIVDEAAVLSALERGHLGGYAADVLDGEVAFGKDCSGHPLVREAKSRHNLLLTPHIGGTTREAREATDVFIARKLRARLESLR